MSEDEIAGWHHQYNGHELGQISGDGEGQSGLVCCSPWGSKESDMAGRLNNSSNNMCINSEMITGVELINISFHIVNFFVMRASEISSLSKCPGFCIIN